MGGDIFSSFFGGGGKTGRASNFSFDFGGQPFGTTGGFGNRPAGRNTELSLELTFEEAVFGGKKTVSLSSGSTVDKISLSIPPGIEDGKKLKVKGKGLADPLTGKRGDLFCKISIKPHQIFQRDGKHLILEKEVKITDLVLGGTVGINTLDHKTLDLKIPPLTKNNSMLRVKGKGISKSGAEAGNLLVRLVAIIPTKLSKRQKELFLELVETGL